MGSHNGSPILQPKYFILQPVSVSFAFIRRERTGASKHNVIQATEWGDRVIETGWFRV